MNAWSQAAMSALSAAAVHAAAVTPVDLRCEYLENPQGIDAPAPRLQWRLQADMDVRGITQSAYQIVVDGAWDSGKVTSARSVNVAYAGKSLESGKLYRWKVRVWDGRDEPSAWSASVSWTMGLLKPGDWTAEWISTEVTAPAPAARGNLKILKATYTAKDGACSADVTAAVAARVNDGCLTMEVKPDQLGGDPALNHVKVLRVEYEWNGKMAAASAVDFRPLTLPPRSTTVPAPLDAPYVRRTFTLEAVPESAVATVNVLGYYELYVNGSKAAS